MRLRSFLLIFQYVDDDDNLYNDCGTRDDGNGSLSHLYAFIFMHDDEKNPLCVLA